MKKAGRPPIRRRRAHIKQHLMVTGVSGVELHRYMLEHGYFVSLSSIYNWIHAVGPGPDAAAVKLIARCVGRVPATLYRRNK